MRLTFAAVSLMVASAAVCSPAHALTLQCWVGDRSGDELADNFMVDTDDNHFEWSGGEASHPTHASIKSLGDEVAIAVVKDPAQQGGVVIAEEQESQIFTIFIDKGKKYHIYGDIMQDGSCE